MPVLGLEMVDPLVRTGASARLPDPVEGRFGPGDRVRARNLNPVGHTRLPRYIRGKRGWVRSDHGVFAFPDTTAHGLGHKPQHLYSVGFSARELWGEPAPEHDTVFIDLFDDYLDRDDTAPSTGKAAPRARRTHRPGR
jgi:nitrile hydratase subunit beta